MIRFVMLLCFLLVLSITLFAGLRSEPVPQMFEHQDWLHHAAAFAALVCTARLAFPTPHSFWILLYALLLALLIELLQGLMPLRTPSYGDMLANILGATLGLAAGLFVRHYARLWANGQAQSRSSR